MVHTLRIWCAVAPPPGRDVVAVARSVVCSVTTVPLETEKAVIS